MAICMLTAINRCKISKICVYSEYCIMSVNATVE